MSDEVIRQLAAHIATDILHQPKRVLAPDQALLSSGMVDSFSLVDLARMWKIRLVCIWTTPNSTKRPLTRWRSWLP